MTNKDFTTSFVVTQSPTDVFAAVIKPQEWWSDLIVGKASSVGDIFDYQYQDIHKTKIKIIEVIPNKKVVWEVLENYFNFTKDKSEWVKNRMIFEITNEDGKTKLTFTQAGLVPDYECYEVCNQAWTSYINGSLKTLIETGEGLVSKKDEINGETKEIRAKMISESDGKSHKIDYMTEFSVDKSPIDAFNAIIDVRGWWSGDIVGNPDASGAEFTYRYKDIHYSKQKVTEFIPGKKIDWNVLESNLSFLQMKNEWDNTNIVFELSNKSGKTVVRFTHVGLFSEIECYEQCSSAWNLIINKNLRNFIITGETQPDVFA